MHAAALVNQPARTVSWTGRTLSGLVIAFMVLDGVIHILKPAPVVDAFAQLGFPLRLAIGIGIVELVCTALYAIPRTAVLGALLLTGYLGGAIATQLRAGAGWFPTIFPLIIAALLWGGLALRDARVRALASL
jgi:DoxX-like protein